MKIVRNQLTARQVTTLAPGFYCDGDGLYLRVTPTSRNWMFRYTPPGSRKQRHMGLGPTRHVTLAEARDRVYEARKLIRDGKDPIEERRKAGEQTAQAAAKFSKIPTFAECARLHLPERLKGRTLGYQKQMHRYIEATFPILGDMHVDAPRADHIKQVLEPIWLAEPRKAQHTRTALGWVFNYARACNYRVDNPADLVGTILPRQNHQPRHHDAVHYEDIPAFMAKLRTYDGIEYRAVEFTILTATRSIESRGALWDEFELDPKRRVWTIPAKRMKMRIEHHIPLSRRALTILDELKAIRQSDYVFPAMIAKHIHEHQLLEALKEIAGDRSKTIHGTARSSFATWAEEVTDFDERMVMMATAHKVKGDTEAAYARGTKLEKRRALMEAWADYCNGGLR
jgi:integrase